MVHFERIFELLITMINSTTKLYMKKVSRYIKAISIFFPQNYLNVHLNESGFDSLL